jgi:hypothetical protein
VTWYNTLVAITSLFVFGAPTLLTSWSCYATDVPQHNSVSANIVSADSFELRAFAAEADFWDGRASLDVHLPFEWCLATEIAPRRVEATVTASRPPEIPNADAYRAMIQETVTTDRPLVVQPAVVAYRATEADILNIRVPTKISTTYADWLLTNGILVPKLNTPGQGVDLGYNLQLQRWY